MSIWTSWSPFLVVTDFWGWSAHRAQLRCPDDVSYDIYERGVPGGALNINSAGYPDHGRYGDLPLKGKIPTAEPGIEPGNSRLAVRSSDHQTTGLVDSKYYFFPMPPHVPYWLRGLPSRLWPKCNRLLSLGRPWSAVTLSRWGGWWYINIKYQKGP
jgi:hypothetical protein